MAMQLEIAQLSLRYASLRVDDATHRARLLASLAQHGQHTPVAVVHASDGADRYVLIDGYARVAALRELASDVVDAVVLELSETDALMISHRLDGQRRRSALEDGWLLDELMRVHGLSLEDLATRLGRSRSWVSRRLALVSVLPLSVQDRVRRGQLSTYVATKYLVPLARANAAQCATLTANLDGHHPSAREMHRLYIAWRRGDAEQRRRITEHPLLFLKSTEERADTATTLLLRDLRALSALSQRSERKLDEGAWRDAEPHEHLRLSRAWSHARRSFASLEEAARAWESPDAGPGHTHGDPAPST